MHNNNYWYIGSKNKNCFYDQKLRLAAVKRVDSLRLAKP